MKDIVNVVFLIVLATGAAKAEELTVEIHQVGAQGVGESLGTITAADSEWGVIFHPDLSGLSPGLHGFHMHQNPSCEPSKEGGEVTPAGGAGGHFDPEGVDSHDGPYGEGHLGDLPALYVDSQGNATHPVLAPRLEISDLEGHALMLHEGGDNYSNKPELGGGGGRMACGMIK